MRGDDKGNADFALRRFRWNGRFGAENGVQFKEPDCADSRAEQLIRAARCEVYRERAEKARRGEWPGSIFEPALTPADVEVGLFRVVSGLADDREAERAFEATSITLAG